MDVFSALSANASRSSVFTALNIHMFVDETETPIQCHPLMMAPFRSLKQLTWNTPMVFEPKVPLQLAFPHLTELKIDEASSDFLSLMSSSE